MNQTEKKPALKIPHDVVNEQILIAATMVDPVVRAALTTRVRSDQFIDDTHSKVWSAIVACEQRKLAPTPSTLAQLGQLDLSYLTELIASHPVAPSNITHHLEALLWDATRIKSVKGPITELMRALQDPSTTPDRVRALAAQVPTSLQGGGARNFVHDSLKLSHEHANVIAARQSGAALYPFGLDGLDTYGPNDFDERGQSLDGTPLVVTGAAPGKTTVITGISGGGKSTFTAVLILNLARQQRKTLYGAWEMGGGETLELLACISTGISRSRVRAGAISALEFKILCDTMDAISEYVVFMDMPFHKTRGARVTHDEVLDEIHAYIADAGCEIAVFDLWRRAFRRLKEESDEAEALYRQQAIFEETNVHGILVQQQRLKDVETRINPRPSRDGIKGSSAWVDIADQIFGVYLPSLMKGTASTTIEILVMKQRYGKWPITVEFSWDGDIVSLKNGRVVAVDPGSEDELGTRDKLSKKWAKKS